MGFGRILIGMDEIGCVFGVFVCGNMKPDNFCMYPCRGVLHTLRNAPRRRSRPKTGCVFGRIRVGAQKHTPLHVLRRRFGSKTGWVFEAVLIGMDEIGCVFDVSVCGNVKPSRFFMYPCRGVLNTPPKSLSPKVCA